MYRSKFEDNQLNELFDAILRLESREECYKFFEDICTIKELKSLAQRLHVAKLLDKNKTYQYIKEKTGASTTTITRISSTFEYGSGGYKLILDKLKK